MKRYIVAGFMMVAAAFGAMGADDVWLTDLAQAKKVAAEKKIPILIDFSGSDWCGWCIRLDKEVFSQKEFIAYAKDNLVLVLADYPREKKQSDALKKQNAALAEKYRIEGFPTVLLLNAEGKELARTGYEPGGAVKYVERIKGLLAKVQEKDKK